MKQFLIAIDQLLNTMIPTAGEGFGKSDETISARAWRLREKKVWNAAKIVIDSFFLRFFSEKDHCEQSYLSELRRKQLPPEYSNYECKNHSTPN